MNQIDRIQRMEQNLNDATAALQQLSDGLAAYSAVRPQLEELSAYLSGGQWLEDYEADEANLLPRDLKRGVLSQDALYQLLAEYDQLLIAMKEAANHERNC